MNNKAKIHFLIFFCLSFFSTIAQQKNLDKYLKNCGLADVQEVNKNIRVQLAYSTTKNFIGLDMYGNLQKCYLPLEVAEAVSKAEKYVNAISSFYHLVIFDGTRPLYIQQLMWDSLKLPIEQKTKYLAYPGNISLHNYGAAVDIGLITADGRIVDMGTPFDFFGPEAHITNEEQLLKDGKLSKEQLLNRRLLRKAMVAAGFKTMSTEWWHFNYCTKEEAAVKFQLIK